MLSRKDVSQHGNHPTHSEVAHITEGDVASVRVVTDRRAHRELGLAMVPKRQNILDFFLLLRLTDGSLLILTRECQQ